MRRNTGQPETPASGNHPTAEGDRAGRRLHRDDIVRAAIAVADDEGPQAVSMRRIAAELGVGTMSLYWHIGSKEQLIDLMLDAVTGEVAMPDPPSGDWRQDLRTIATQTRLVLKRHAWLVSFLKVWPWWGPNLFRREELSLAAFDGLDIDPSTAMLAANAVDEYVMGFVLGELRMGAVSAREKAGSHESRDAAARADALLASGEFPRLARLQATGEEPDADARFGFGLNCLLDGLAMRLGDAS